MVCWKSNMGNPFVYMLYCHPVFAKVIGYITQKSSVYTIFNFIKHGWLGSTNSFFSPSTKKRNPGCKVYLTRWFKRISSNILPISLAQYSRNEKKLNKNLSGWTLLLSWNYYDGALLFLRLMTRFTLCYLLHHL